MFALIAAIPSSLVEFVPERVVLWVLEAVMLRAVTGLGVVLMLRKVPKEPGVVDRKQICEEIQRAKDVVPNF